MTKMLHCRYLDREGEALPSPPYPGELGRRIHEQISREAWSMWLKHQTTLINEYRLTPVEPRSRKFLEQEMEKFLFHGGAEKPSDYVPPKT